jgi:hypothetical protein
MHFPSAEAQLVGMRRRFSASRVIKASQRITFDFVKKIPIAQSWQSNNKHLKRMSNQREVFFADEENAGSKLSRKAKESPFMVVGKFETDKKLKVGKT